ncbi:hypothetical protein WM04_12260 [Burkholderia ubonensis]|nr:hypothetical protein WI79_08635 [Burkholderia ubonensis]KWI32847.1 hypothetical protein WM04_12260 [Burkholderia ubonensis]OJB19344.1 hypothetical protein BGV53_07855 [Burkholderia ubonensis]
MNAFVSYLRTAMTHEDYENGAISLMYKRRIVRWFVAWTDSWNREIHEAIEAKVHAEFRAQFPQGLRNEEDTEPMIERMRSFYYARMTNTATLLVAVSSVLVSFCALAVSIVALKH